MKRIAISIFTLMAGSFLSAQITPQAAQAVQSQAHSAVQASNPAPADQQAKPSHAAAKPSAVTAKAASKPAPVAAKSSPAADKAASKPASVAVKATPVAVKAASTAQKPVPAATKTSAAVKATTPVSVAAKPTVPAPKKPKAPVPAVVAVKPAAPVKAAAPKSVSTKVAPPKPAVKKASTTEEPKVKEAMVKTETAVPEPKPVINLTGRRDPFTSPVVRALNVNQGSGCSSGKRCLAVDQITLRGIVRAPSGMIAVVENSAKRAYFLRENDPVWHGMVEKINGDSVVFREDSVDTKSGKATSHEVVKRVNAPVV